MKTGPSALENVRIERTPPVRTGRFDRRAARARQDNVIRWMRRFAATGAQSSRTGVQPRPRAQQ
jgi:hypothetical protein